MYDIIKPSIRKVRGEIIMDSKDKIIMNSKGEIIMDSKWSALGKGLAICGICGLIVAELYFKAPGWVFGWSLFALIISL
jgi:hypothetical protein